MEVRPGECEAGELGLFPEARGPVAPRWYNGRVLTLPLLVLIGLSRSRVQNPSAGAFDAVQRAFQQMAKGQYLVAIGELESAYGSGNQADHWYVGQFLGMAYSFVGQYDQAAYTFDTAVPPSLPAAAVDPGLLSASSEDALSAIGREARGRQIVILNEAHHEPRCRAFALQLARELRKQGFEYFAAETFNSQIFESWQAGYPMQGSGRYLADPVFGDLVRQAIKLGFKPMNYESETPRQPGDATGSQEHREIEQAQNLINRILKPHSSARIFIYCGYAHATKEWQKSDDGREVAYMAARLKRSTGIDPLTIDQSQQFSHPLRDPESAEFRMATDKWFRNPLVFRLRSGAWGVFGPDWKGNVDMQIFHPRDRDVDGRPAWLAMAGYRKRLRVPLPAHNTRRLLVQAFVASEPRDEIPMDQVVAYPGRRAAILMLPTGSYRIVTQDDAGRFETLESRVKV